MTEPIAEDVRRFILTSILSVPHLEAMLLLRGERGEPWSAARTAQRLYVSEETAAQLLGDLCAAGVLVASGMDTPVYRYRPVSAELTLMIDRVAAAYAANIVEVAELIHSKAGKKARQFADAFKFRKDS
jgi:hypothetical protein